MFAFRSSLLEMQPYQPPLEGRSEGDFLHLDFNESTRQPPQFVFDAIREELDRNRLQRYPEYQGLAQVIADYVGCTPAQCMATNGSDQAIEILFRAVLDPGQRLLLVRPTFAMFEQMAALQQAQVVALDYGPRLEFPAVELRRELDKTAVRLCVLVDPNNPTGTAVPQGLIAELSAEFPQTFFLIDEAYAEFSGHSSAALIERRSNIAVLRTLSKAFALSALRFGYLVAGEDVVEQLLKVRGPYDVNRLAAVAARAALARPEYALEYAREVMQRTRPALLEALAQRGLDVIPGAANFVLIRMGDPARVVAAMRQRGILVRPGRAQAADRVRISMGPPETLDPLLRALDEVLVEVES